MILECRGVSCAFGSVYGLSDVTVKIRDGECVGVIGDNGAGKTTLLNVICGVVEPSDGRIVFNDVDITNWPFDRRARAGVIRTFEDCGVWNRVSVLDNVALGAYGLGITLNAARDAALHHLRRFGLEHAAEREAEGLSLGEKRRMELARAVLRYELLGTRSLLILDEPTRGLDHEGKRMLVALLQHHVVGRCAALMVEHDVELARRLCSRLVTLKAGRVDETRSQVPVADRDRPAVGTSVTQQTALQAVDIRAGYGGEDVLRGVSFSLRYGEAVQLRGTNGSGKSTLLKAIVGTLRPSAGRIVLDGCDLKLRDGRIQRGVGYAPQGGRLIRGLSVAAHLELARAAARGTGESRAADERFAQIFPELKELLLSSAESLSSGQRSLVALWTALATGPKVLLADEPAAGLAPEARRRVYEFLRIEWLRPDRAVLFVEHGAAEAWVRSLTLDRGQLLAPEDEDMWMPSLPTLGSD
jgi:ABC-type branched-subunit amino acid transport system ATPase component